MERMCIAAFTETTGESFPAFVSIYRESDGTFSLTARERGNAGEKMVKLEIPASKLGGLAEEIIDRLGDIAIAEASEERDE